MKVPDELVGELTRGNGVLFVGAGLSVGAGLPSWSELLMPLADLIDLPNEYRGSLLRVAQFYENKKGRHALLRYICDQTATTSKRPTNNHRRLLKLGIRTWLTTNYDQLLEKALDEGGYSYNLVVRDRNLPYTSADRVTLVKLHGDRSHPDSIVITEHDFYTYFRRYPGIRTKLAGLLLEKTFLFVGYSMQDPDFNAIRAEIG